jgi:hypothetical protein
MMSRVLRQLLVQVHGSIGSHHLETRTKKVISRTENRRMVKIFDDEWEFDSSKIKINIFLIS